MATNNVYAILSCPNLSWPPVYSKNEILPEEGEGRGDRKWKSEKRHDSAGASQQQKNSFFCATPNPMVSVSMKRQTDVVRTGKSSENAEPCGPIDRILITPTC
ncbi:Hypothetical protein NTJ_03003 [Nesidiocoris tenuis]|uniref:Uncharacterized protein n=1 Tax=Nesidiocoris tenuis TaxID=355587 RepID=A0ABN7AG84_9HEMI|nr:Hypothetical protein NTJ_03003 [Nesidiocoris tenuis]